MSAPGATNPTWKSIRVQNTSESPVATAALPSPSNPVGAYQSTGGLNNQAMRTINPSITPRGMPLNQGPRFTFQNTSMATLNQNGAMTSGASTPSNASNMSSPYGTMPRGGPPPPRVGHTATRVEFSQPKLTIVKDPKLLPTPTLLSEVDPVRDFSLPAHKFPARKVDSRSEAKLSQESRQMALTGPRGVPPFVGTTFTHLPNHHVPLPHSPPARATVPRIYPSLTGEEYSNAGMLLNNRTASGRILGNVAQRIISDTHVPYLPPEEAVGPDNPYVVINDTWAKCWDKEAGAVYYYNQLTGEATWIAPEL